MPTNQPPSNPPPPPTPSPNTEILSQYNKLLDESIKLSRNLGEIELNKELTQKKSISNLTEANKNLESQKIIFKDLDKRYKDLNKTTSILVEDWSKILESINNTSKEVAKTSSSFNKLEGIARHLESHMKGIYNMSSEDFRISIAKSKAEKINLELAEKQLKKKQKLGKLNDDERKALADIKKSIRDNNSLYDRTLNNLKEQYRQQKNIENATGLTGKLLKSSQGLLEKMGMESLSNVFEEANIAAEATANKLTEGGNKTATLFIKVRSIASAFKVVGKAIKENLSDPLVLAFGAFKLAKGIIGGVVGFIKKTFDFLVNKATESITAYKEIASVVSSEIQGIARSANLGAAAAAKIYSRVVSMGPTAAASAQSFTQIQTALGNMDDLGDATYNHMVKLNIYAGYSAESFAGMQKYAKLLGKDTKKISENVMDTALAEIRSQKVATTQKEVYEDVAKLSNNIKLTLGGSEKSITKAVVTSKKLGLALEDALSAAKGFLNIEESISNEQELSLLTGKEVNLNQLRYFAATRNVTGVQSELTKLVNEHGQSILNNQFAMDALTKTTGLSEDAILNIIAGTKQNISATDQLNKEKKKGSDIDNQQATFSESEEMRQRGLTAMRAKGGAIFFEVLKKIEHITAKINGMFTEVFGKHFAAWWNDSNVQKGLNTLEENVTRIFGLLLKDGGALDTIFKTIFSTNNTSGPLNFLNQVLAKGGPVEKNIEALNDILKGKKPDENTFLGGLYKIFMDIKGFFDKYGKILVGGVAINIGLKELTGKGLGDVFSGIFNKFFGRGSKNNPMFVELADGSPNLTDTVTPSQAENAGRPIKSTVVDKAKDTVKPPQARDAKGRFIKSTVVDKAKDTTTNSTKDITDKTKDISSNGKNLKNTIENVSKGIRNAIKEFFKGIENALTSLGKGLKNIITDVFKGIENAFTSVGKGLKNIITDVFKGIENALTSLGKGIGKAVSNISKGIGKSLEVLGKGIGKGIQSILNALGPGLSTLGKGLGNFIGSIGKGVGTAIGAIFKGIATGLKAFADPMILLGAGILSGAILSIGASIAGATWLMGKALPSLAEGLEAFNNVKGDNLKNVGIGFAAFGAGLSLMGSGMIMTAFGGLIDGIATFFGGGIENTLKKVEDFGKYNFDTKKIKNNAESIAYWAKGMALMAVGSGAGAIGSIANLVGSIADGLVTFFGGELPLSKISNFASVSLGDPNQAKQNSLVIREWANGMKMISESTGGGGFFSAIGKLASTMVEGLITFFQKPIPYSDIKIFGSQNLGNPNQIKQNVESITSYFIGLSSIKNLPQKNILEAIGDLFTFELKLPYDKLLEFAKGGPNGELSNLNSTTIKNVSDIVTSYLNALKQIDETPSSDIINKIFGDVTIPWSKLLEFAKGGPNGELSNLNSTTIENVSNIVTSYLNALKQIDETPSPDIINQMFGDVTIPWSKLLEFAKGGPNKELNTINVTTIENVSDVVTGYLNALKQIDETPSPDIINQIFGDVTIPWSELKVFGQGGPTGELNTINVTTIENISKIVTSYINALKQIDETPPPDLSNIIFGDVTIPWNKLLEFGQGGPTGELSTINVNTINNISNIVAGYINALKKIAETPSRDLSKIVFGDVTIPWNKLLEFGQGGPQKQLSNLNSTTIINVSDVVTGYLNALKKISETPIPNFSKDFWGTVIIPWENIDLFSKQGGYSDLDPKKIMENYYIIQAYAKGISSLNDIKFNTFNLPDYNIIVLLFQQIQLFSSSKISNISLEIFSKTQAIINEYIKVINNLSNINYGKLESLNTKIDFNKIKRQIEILTSVTVPKNTGLTEFIKQINEFANLENVINKLVNGVNKIGNAFRDFKKSVGSTSFPTDFSLPVNITKSVKLTTSEANDLISLGSLNKNKKEKGYGKRVLFDYSEGKRYNINNKDNIVFGTDPSLLKLIKNNFNISSTKKTQTAPEGSIKVDDGFSFGEGINVNFDTFSKIINDISNTKKIIDFLKEIINPEIMVKNLTKVINKISWLKILNQISKLLSLNQMLSNENLSSKEKANISIVTGAKAIGTILGTTLGASLAGTFTSGVGTFVGGSIGGYLGEILGEYIGESKPIRDTLSPPIAKIIDKNYKSKPVANDFIWRPGQGIERFSEQDTLMGVKEKPSNASAPNNTEVITLLKELINVSKSPQGNNKSQPTNITITLDGKTIASTSLDIYGGNAYKINS